MESHALNLRRWFLTIFALSCLGLNVIAFILYEKNQEINDNKQWVLHTYLVLTDTVDLFSTMQDMETAQRGFLLTADDQFLEPYKKANATIILKIQALMELTKDSPERQEQLNHYQAIVEQQRSLMAHQIAMRRAHKKLTVGDMNKNRVLMDKVRAINATIIDEEKNLLARRIAEDRIHQRNYVNTIFASAGFAVLGLLISNGFIVVLTIRRQAAEASLRRLHQEMEGFTYIASHDLRSPLVNLKGFASEMEIGLGEIDPILRKALNLVPEQEREKALTVLHHDIPDALHYIHSSVEKMDNLTSAILELSRIGRKEIRVEQVHPQTIVHRIIDTLHHQINTQNISIRVHALPEVMADKLALEQIFGNIIDNAIKYLEPSRAGKIEIGGSKNFRETTFWVRDNGRGIPEHDREKIFEIYRRGGNNKDIPGEGLGMAYVRATLRRMDGSIWCESVVNEGTTFYFTISNSLQKEDKYG